VTLLLNEFDAPDTRSARSYSFPAPVDNGIGDPNVADTGTIVFPVTGIVAGDYLVRVQVDGAQSLLAPAAGKFNSPKITIA
jgi:hypothetical protein